MPQVFTPQQPQIRHTDDIQDIITAAPNWMLRWGITVFFFVIMLIVGLSAFITYPDIVKTQLKISSPNPPKPVVAKIAGKLVKLLINPNDIVKENQPLAYIQSTANHAEVLALLISLKELQKHVSTSDQHIIAPPAGLQLGELQVTYQTFYNSFYLKKKTNTINKENSKFLQALNSLINDVESWKNRYILSSPQAGKVTFAGIIQQDQMLNINQEVFYINPGNQRFFGDMTIPQTSMGKVKEGQEVLIKLKSYPYQEYGMLHGRISYIADMLYKDSIFISRVDVKVQNVSDMKKPIHLKNGMTADAEIITQNATVLSRITRNFLKVLN